jgi:transposase
MKAALNARVQGAPALAMQAFERFIGLDVHKRTVVACVTDAGGRTLHSETFACNQASLRDFAARWMGPTAAVAVECSTNTWAVAGVLEPLCGELAISNPMRTKAIAEGAVKTDKVDAGVLAHLLRCDYLPRVWIPDAQTRELRRLTTRRTTLVQEGTALRNRIHSHLAAELIEVPVARLFGAAGLEWLRTLDGLSAQGRSFIDSELRLLDTVEKERERVQAELATIAYRHEQAKLLMTLPGVDFPVALSLLAALGDVNRFKEPGQAASYLGLVASTKQSGDNCYHGPMTKRGSSHARWMMVQAAQQLDKHPGPLGNFFRRLAAKKHRNIAVVATARKLVCIAVMMLKRNEPYRYAQPSTVQAKLARLRIQGGGERRKGGLPKGSSRHPIWGSGQGYRRTPGLAAVYASEGLPQPVALDDLPPGERRMLETAGVLEAVRQQRQPSARPKPKPSEDGNEVRAPRRSASPSASRRRARQTLPADGDGTGITESTI